MDNSHSKDKTAESSKQTDGIASVGAIDLALRNEPDLKLAAEPEAGTGRLFAEAFSFEINRSVRGAAQLVGADKYLSQQAEPEEARDAVGQNVQMLGRAAGGVLPAIAIGAATRFGFGKFLTHEGGAAEIVLLQRSATGLSVAESGTTGFLVGSLLTPTENISDQTFSAVVADRMKSGGTSGLAFSLMAASSIGLNKVASSEIGMAVHADKIMKGTLVNGVISGIPAGLANVEADSIVRHGTVDFDAEKIGKSMYEMSLFGGTFGMGSRLIGRAGRARESVDTVTGHSVIEPGTNSSSSKGDLEISDPAADRAKEKLLAYSSPELVNNLHSQILQENAKEKSISDSDGIKLHDATDSQSAAHTLDKLADWIAVSPETRPALVAKLWETGGNSSEPLHAKLDGVQRLSALFPEPVVESLLFKMGRGQLPSLSDVAGYVERDPVPRIPFLESQLNTASALRITGARLEALQNIEGRFGDATVATSKILKMEVMGLRLPELSNFLDENPDVRVPHIERMMRYSDQVLNVERLRAIESFERSFPANSIVLAKVLEKNDAVSVQQLNDLTEFVKHNPSRVHWLEDLVGKSPDFDILSSGNVQGLESLERRFGKGSETVAGIQEMQTNGWFDLQGVAQFIDKDPAVRAPMVADMVSRKLPYSEYSPHRLEANEQLKESFANAPATVARLQELEAEHRMFNFIDLAQFVSEKPETRADLVTKLIETSPDRAPRMDVSHLDALDKLQAMFGSSSLLIEKVKDTHDDLQKLVEFINENPKRKQLIESVFSNALNDGALNPESLQGLEKILDASKSDAKLSERLTRAYDGRITPEQILEIIETPRGKQFVQELLESNVPLTQIRPRTVHPLYELSQEFSLGSPQMQRLIELDREGLKLDKVVELKQANPQQYQSIMEFVLGEKTDATSKLSGKFSSGAKLAAFVNELGWLSPESEVSLMQFLKAQPESRVALTERQLPDIREQTIRPTRGRNIEPQRLASLERLTQDFDNDPKVMKAILKAEGGSVSLSEIDRFVNEDPVANKMIVEQIALNLQSSDELTYDHMSAVKGLQRRFGAESDTVSDLMSYHAHDRLNLIELNRYLADNPSEMGTIDELVRQRADARFLEADRLIARDKLTKLFKNDPERLQSILAAESNDGWDLTHVLRFINGSVENEKQDALISEHRQNEIPDRATFFENLAKAHDRLSFTRGAWDLEQSYQFAKQFGFGSATFEMLNKFQSERADVDVVETFITKHRDGKAFIEKLASVSADIEPFLAVESLKKVYDAVGPSDQALDRLVRGMKRKTFNVETIAAFIDAAPQPNSLLVRELAGESQLASGLSFHSLNGWSKLRDALGADSEEFRKLLESDKRVNVVQLAKLLEDDSEMLSVVKTAARALEKDGTVDLDLDALRHMQDLRAELRLDQKTFDQIVAAHEFGADVRAMHQIILRYPDTGPSLITQLLKEHAGSDQFQTSYLLARGALEHSYGMNSERVGKVLAYSTNPVYLQEVSDFVHGNERPERAWRVLDAFMNAHVIPENSNFKALVSAQHLDSYFGGDQTRLTQLVELAKNGVDLEKLYSFVLDSPSSHLNFVKTLLDQGKSADSFSESRLRERFELTKLTADGSLASGDLAYIEQMFDQNTVSASRIANFVRENPQAREALISKLVAEKADPKLFNDVMSLGMFPEPVSLDLARAASNGGMSTASILGNLRPIQSGQNFYDLVLEHVNSKAVLSKSELQGLADKAQMLPPAVHPIQDAHVGIVPSKNDAELAEIHKESVRRIQEEVPQDKDVVLLGRDMWTMLPLVKRSHNVQYFLWSRNQINNDATKHQWLAEVPPNAVVIDTGFSGSIISAIRKIDTGASGLLLSSSGTYPRLLNTPAHDDMAGRIESIPKLIGSASRYTDLGNAVSKPAHRDENDVAKRPGNLGTPDRWRYEREVKSLFRAMGLPEWDTWRYSQFVGLTPKERLGLNTDQSVQKHYDRIRQMRQPAPVESENQTVETGSIMPQMSGLVL